MFILLKIKGSSPSVLDQFATAGTRSVIVLALTCFDLTEIDQKLGQKF